MKTYKSEQSINKVLAELQLANTIVKDAQEDTFEEMLREALMSENEAIKIYLKLKEKSEALGSKVLIKAFSELVKDEQEHVGNLNYLMKLLCEDAVEVEKDGEEEEAKLQHGIED